MRQISLIKDAEQPDWITQNKEGKKSEQLLVGRILYRHCVRQAPVLKACKPQ
jgi:hypothetical protein